MVASVYGYEFNAFSYNEQHMAHPKVHELNDSAPRMPSTETH
jgi:hypothetical protein